jgi:hypothetical protein
MLVIMKPNRPLRPLRLHDHAHDHAHDHGAGSQVAGGWAVGGGVLSPA